MGSAGETGAGLCLFCELQRQSEHTVGTLCLLGPPIACSLHVSAVVYSVIYLIGSSMRWRLLQCGRFLGLTLRCLLPHMVDMFTQNSEAGGEFRRIIGRTAKADQLEKPISVVPLPFCDGVSNSGFCCRQLLLLLLLLVFFADAALPLTVTARLLVQI